VEELFKEVASKIALGVEVVAVLIVAYGASEAFLRILKPMFGTPKTHGERKDTWMRFGVWLLLGLEFELAADIVRSVISPTWVEIGQLAAIAVIRTFLNYFLEKDVEKYAEPRQEAETQTLAKEAARATR
jgi:uncharacterized membrane protein